MVEVSNKSLAVLVLVVLAVVVGGTLFTLQSQKQVYGITGRATSDTGTVNLTINGTLAIQVATGYNSISFGTCSPRPGSAYWCSTNDTDACSGTNSLGNCSGDNVTPQYIRIDNVGNINASVNVTSECTADTLIGGTSPLFQFVTTACNGTGVSTWTSLSATTASACDNVAYLGGQMRFYVNVTIPQDAVGGSGSCVDNQATVTFSAISAS